MDRMKVPLKSIERAESAVSLNESLRLPVLAQLSGHVDSKCRLTLFCGVYPMTKIFFVSLTLPLLHFYAKFQLWNIIPCVHFPTFI